MTVSNLRPRRHHILAELRFLLPSSSAQAISFVRAPNKDILPNELPAYLRRRLIAFLSETYPVPPRQLEPLLPASEAEGARKMFKRLVKEGLSPGEAIVEMGILAHKEWFNVPSCSQATILNAGCDCVGGPGFRGVVASSAGRVVDRGIRDLECDEFLGELTAEVPTAPY